MFDSDLFRAPSGMFERTKPIPNQKLVVTTRSSRAETGLWSGLSHAAVAFCATAIMLIAAPLANMKSRRVDDAAGRTHARAAEKAPLKEAPRASLRLVRAAQQLARVMPVAPAEDDGFTDPDYD